MNIVTASATPVVVTKVLPAGVVTTYVSGAAGNVSVVITFKGTTTMYNATVVNSSLTVAGSISASIPFAIAGMYQITIVSESNTDLDTNSTVTTKVATSSVMAYTPMTAVSI